MKKISILLLVVSLLLTGCAPAAESAQTDTLQVSTQQIDPKESEVKKPVDLTAVTEKETAKKWDDISGEDPVIFLAGGCFWGMQKYLQTIPGVKRTVVGYANGKWEREYPLTYDAVKTGKTGFREAVYVEYDPEEVSLDTILFAFFYVIDPTVESRQGGDIGPQYQTGIYYTNDEAKKVIDRILAIETERYPKIVVEIEPLEVFYEAEEYHQNYLEKNPNGACHISEGQIAWMEQIVVDPADYRRPDAEEIKGCLTELQYQVTQEDVDEEEFNNKYWDFFEKGIYVDAVSGEPLFSSLDKFESPHGWPAFSKGIDVNTFFFTINPDDEEDRLVIRSRAANSYLGYIYQGDPDSATGNRFCINSAALEFIPYEEMDAAGYGYLKFLFDEAQDTGYTSITAQRAKELMDAGGVFVVDVREDYEYQESHIPGAISLPLSTMNVESGEKITEDKDSVILIYCRSGNRSKTAAAYFAEMGYTNVYEFGGILGWPYEVVKGDG